MIYYSSHRKLVHASKTGTVNSEVTPLAHVGSEGRDAAVPWTHTVLLQSQELSSAPPAFPLLGTCSSLNSILLIFLAKLTFASPFLSKSLLYTQHRLTHVSNLPAGRRGTYIRSMPSNCLSRRRFSIAGFSSPIDLSAPIRQESCDKEDKVL